MTPFPAQPAARRKNVPVKHGFRTAQITEAEESKRRRFPNDHSQSGRQNCTLLLPEGSLNLFSSCAKSSVELFYYAI